MLMYIADVPGDIALNKWHRVRELDGVYPEGIYIHFTRAWDLQGGSLDKLPKGMTVVTEGEYNGLGYP